MSGALLCKSYFVHTMLSRVAVDITRVITRPSRWWFCSKIQ